MQNTIKTKEDARNYAIQWQNWQSTQSLSYSEVLEYQNYFSELGEQFNLTEEFKENGII
jgi:hypothetical protein